MQINRSIHQSINPQEVHLNRHNCKYRLLIVFRPRRLPTWQNMILRSWRSTWRMMAHVHNTPGRQSLEKVKPNEELEAASKSEKISKTRFAFTDDWWDYVCFALVFCCIFVFCQVYILHADVCLRYPWKLSWNWTPGFGGKRVMYLTSTFALFAFVQRGTSWTEVACFR